MAGKGVPRRAQSRRSLQCCQGTLGVSAGEGQCQAAPPGVLVVFARRHKEQRIAEEQQRGPEAGLPHLFCVAAGGHGGEVTHAPAQVQPQALHHGPHGHDAGTGGHGSHRGLHGCGLTGSGREARAWRQRGDQVQRLAELRVTRQVRVAQEHEGFQPRRVLEAVAKARLPEVDEEAVVLGIHHDVVAVQVPVYEAEAVAAARRVPEPCDALWRLQQC
mmetsp:Transcript_27472/g.85485  ORF Transcript_27472/g.85485 Transcript_27472/m.85485 type:complete len:217 (+) Transcript_27472:109-759(+)